MLLIQKFRDDNTDENVDSKISKLAAHNCNLEKKLDFPAKQIRRGSGDKVSQNTKTTQATLQKLAEVIAPLLNEVNDLGTNSSGFKQGWRGGM